MNKLFFGACLLFMACSPDETPSGNPVTNIHPGETHEAVYDSVRNSLKLAVPDTIKRSERFFFSGKEQKDIFMLTILPGLVKDSKSKIEIISPENKVLYTQTFNTFYFIRYIYEPDSVPVSGQEAYDAYLEKYWRSLTLQKYERYFQKSVKELFESIGFLKDRSGLIDWEDDADKDFLSEVKQDTTIRLLDITCYNCDEGGEIIGYSAKQNKVITLLAHD